MRGRGEIVEPVSVGPAWWVLVPMPFGVPVGDSFAWWEASSGEPGPDFLPILERAGGRLERMGDALFNVLEAGVAARHGEVRDAMDLLQELGALVFMHPRKIDYASCAVLHDLCHVINPQAEAGAITEVVLNRVAVITDND